MASLPTTTPQSSMQGGLDGDEGERERALLEALQLDPSELEMLEYMGAEGLPLELTFAPVRGAPPLHGGPGTSASAAGSSKAKGSKLGTGARSPHEGGLGGTREAGRGGGDGVFS